MLDKILEFCFTTSKQPVLLKDLLVANVQHNEKMHVDAARLGFRLNIGNTYLVYILFVSLVLFPLIAFTHKLFMDLDFHVSILASVIFTAIIFIWFNFFKAWIKDKMAGKVIRAAWKIHFPFFSYSEYRYKVEEIFHKAMKAEVQKKDLERFVMDNLIKE